MARDSYFVSTELLANLRTLLKNHPKGMAVSEIAAELGLNRNSMAKYLDILSVGGQIERRAYGPAKVYFLSQRAPLGAILNYTTEFILVLDQQHRILQVNDRFLGFLGRERDALLGVPLDEAHLPILSASGVRSRMLEARSEGEVSIETAITGDGGIRHFRVQLVSTAFDDGSTGLTCIIEEITDRKRFEQALLERERRFREITELSPFPCAIVDDAGNFCYVNTCFSGTFGYTADELGTIERWFELAYPDADYRTHMAEEWARGGSDGAPCEPRFLHLRTRNGEVREVVLRRQQLSDGNHYLVYEDISELRRLENALAERHRLDDALYRSVLQLTEIADEGHSLLFSADLEGRIVQATPLLAEIAGRPEHGLAGQRLDQVFVSPDTDLNRSFIAEVSSSAEDRQVEMVVHRPDGRTVALIASLAPSPAGGGMSPGIVGRRLLSWAPND